MDFVLQTDQITDKYTFKFSFDENCRAKWNSYAAIKYVVEKGTKSTMLKRNDGFQLTSVSRTSSEHIIPQSNSIFVTDADLLIEIHHSIRSSLRNIDDLFGKCRVNTVSCGCFIIRETSRRFVQSFFRIF